MSLACVLSGTAAMLNSRAVACYTAAYMAVHEYQQIANSGTAKEGCQHGRGSSRNMLITWHSMWFHAAYLAFKPGMVVSSVDQWSTMCSGSQPGMLLLCCGLSCRWDSALT
jgi:hypothetical protein